MQKRIVFLVLIFLTTIILLIGFNEDNSSDEDNIITIGGRGYTEQLILVEILAQLIEENTNLTVERKTGIPAKEIHQTLLDKDIDVYPEYTSTAWINILEQPPIGFSNILFRELKNKHLDMYDIVWLDRYGFDNSYGLAMNKVVADEMAIESYSDLATKGHNLILGGEDNFLTRKDAYPGLKDKYRMEFKDIVTLDFVKKYEALKAGEVDVVSIHATDVLLEEYNLKILVDDMNYFSPYEAATVVRIDTLENYPELKEVLNMLGGQISNEEMRRMNYMVEKGGMDPAEVARLFLKSKELI